MTIPRTRFETLWPRLRDALLFFGGLMGVAYETLGEGAERPTLLLLFAAMMGLPAFLRSGNGEAK